MFAYIFRRLLYMPLILFGVILITFALFEMTTTPESQAKLHLGEKSSQRQVYDWLETRGSISWTSAGEEKLALIPDKLSPKVAQLVSADDIDKLPDEIEETKELVEDAKEDVAELEEEFGEDSDEKELNRAKGKLGRHTQNLQRLESKRQNILDGAVAEYVYMAVGKAGIKNVEQVGSVSSTIATLKAQLKKTKAKPHDTDAIKKKIDEAIAAGKDTVVLSANLKKAKDAKEKIAKLNEEIKQKTPDLDALKAKFKSDLNKHAAATKVGKAKYHSLSEIEADFKYATFFWNFKVYLGDIVTLNFGDTRGRRPVSEVMYDGMWPSMALTIPAFFLSEILGVFFGLFAAMFRLSKIDTTIVISSILLMSINGIALIMFGQKFMASDWNYFPVQGYAEGFGAARFLILPIFLYIFITIGGHVRFNRIIMLDETNQDYVRTARAKGVGENSVLFKHIFRNTLIPLITRWAVAIPTLYLGSLVLESFFAIPGLGYLTVDAIVNKDSNVIRAVVVLGSVSFMMANLVSDVLYAVVDPRVKLS